MIITCQACHRRYVLDAARVKGRCRLRCTGCGHVFAIDAPPCDRQVQEMPSPPEPQAHPPVPQGDGPGGEAATVAPPLAGVATVSAASATPPPEKEGAGHAASTREPAAEPEPESSERPCDGTLALLAEPQDGMRRKIEAALGDLGCRVELAADGAAAFRFAVARRPVLMVIDAQLPGLSGNSICEGVKGSPHLRHIKVVLVRSGDGSDAKERGPGEGGAPDDELAGSLPEAALGERLLRVLRGEPAAPVDESERAGAPAEDRDERPQALERVEEMADPAPTAAEVEVPVAPPVVTAEEAARVVDPEGIPSAAAGVQAEIRRLARIMLSDLRLYNPDRFERALHEDQLLETFQAELSRGRDLIARRFPDVPDRLELLTAALREEIEQERTESSSVPHGRRA